MAKFNLFKKKAKKGSNGFHSLIIKDIKSLTDASVQIDLDIPEELKKDFLFKPGQYLDFEFVIDKEKLRRSYSICSGPKDNVSIGVKAIEGGKVSNWFKNEAKKGDALFVAPPNGQFVYGEEKSIVCFAAGSGITPILSIAKHAKFIGAKVQLYYGNKSEASTMYVNELKSLLGDDLHLFFTEKVEAIGRKGRLDAENLSAIVKENLDLLKADAFFLCGPQGMIEAVNEKLNTFGVPLHKIKKELFVANDLEDNSEGSQDEVVKSLVTVTLDGEEIDVQFKPKGKTILELLDAEGYDPPYSCRGGVCSTCKAKITEGSAIMKVNYTLTDEEVANGEILCCQAQPTSSKLKVTFDD